MTPTASAGPDAVALRGVTKTFGETIAVRDLDLVVPRGALYGIIGPNGAGKTTAIRILLSILFPDRGEVSVLGHPSASEAKDRIGYLPEERGLYRKMRVGQFLAYVARLKNDEQPDLAGRVRTWLDRVGLSGVERQRCEELSKGMQQKVQFLAAVIHRPDLLVLDEPFSGLDPISQRLLLELIVDEHRRGATVLFSTHVMFHAEQLCDHVVMIHRGRKVLDSGLSEIRAQYDPRRIVFEPIDPQADVTALRAVPGVEGVVRDGRGWDVVLMAGADPAAVMHAVTGVVATARLELRRPTLEDVFIEKVAAHGGDDEVRLLRAAVRDEAVAALETSA